MGRNAHSNDVKGIPAAEGKVLTHRLASPQTSVKLSHTRLANPDSPVVGAHLGVAKQGVNEPHGVVRREEGVDDVSGFQGLTWWQLV